jgi:hypothetical protein
LLRAPSARPSSTPARFPISVAEARELFERVALADEFLEFLILPAYEYIE